MEACHKILTALLPICMLLASTCQDEDLHGTKKVELTSPFGLSLNEKATIGNSGLLLEVSEINDSRCPANVQCIWAGNAQVKLYVTGSGMENTELSFCIGQCDKRFKQADTLSVHHQNQGYQIILSEVNPYPGTGDQQKTAIFLLKKN